MEYSFKEISEMQKWSLSEKINASVKAIATGFAVSQSRTAIAFSGGKDSTVLWHLIKTYFPDEALKTAVIFGNTGVEYPESLTFARKLGKEWGGDNFIETTPGRLEKDELKYSAQKQVIKHLVETGQIQKVLKKDGKLKSEKALERACPREMWEEFEREGLIWKAGTLKSYWWCADKYGFPILGKGFSKLKAQRANIDCFLQFSETKSENEETLQYYEILREVKISQACCDILKKEPSDRVQSELKIDVIFKGLMADESDKRKINFSTRGYLFRSKRKYINTPFYHCNPLSIWTDKDIWEYIRRFNVPYSPLYDMTYKDADGNECRMKRNGCIGCYTDYGRKNSHMYVLRQTHLGLWKAVMNYGMGAEIQKLVTCGSERFKPSKANYKRLGIHQSILFIEDEEERAEAVAKALRFQPCAFD